MTNGWVGKDVDSINMFPTFNGSIGFRVFKKDVEEGMVEFSICHKNDVEFTIVRDVDLNNKITEMYPENVDVYINNTCNNYNLNDYPLVSHNN